MQVKSAIDREARLSVPSAVGSHSAHVVAEPGNPLRVGALMPGAVVTVPVTAGQSVQSGDPLLSLEAMKMEMHITAERSGTIEKVFVKAGDRVQAKDLLIVWHG